MKKRRKEFVHVKKILEDVLRDIEVSSSETTVQVERVWQQVVGADIASLARVHGVFSSTVELEVEGSAVLSEIEMFYKDRFLRALEEEGVPGIEKVAFRIGGS